MYLYNSYKGKSSLTKIIGAKNINILKDVIENELYDEADSNIIEVLKEIGFITELSETQEKEQRFAKVKSIKNDSNLYLTIMPTEYCNFNCVYCYENSNKNAFMTKQTKDNLVAFVNEKMKECSNLIVSWFGGEPLLALDTIRSLSSDFIRITNSQNKSYIASMTTNGYLLTPEIVKELLRYKVISYQITIDGPPETHNKLRVYSNGKNTYETIVTNILLISKKINSSFLNITIRTNFTRQILDRINELVVEFNKIKNKHINFSINLAADWGGDSVNSIRNELLDLTYYPQIIDCLLRGSSDLDYSGHLINYDSDGCVCTYYKKNSYIIGYDGNVSKCTMKTDISLGNINQKDTLNNIEDGFSVDILGFKECDNCFFSGSCLGVACPKANESHMRACPPEKEYIEKFFQLLPDSCFKIITNIS